MTQDLRILTTCQITLINGNHYLGHIDGIEESAIKFCAALKNDKPYNGDINFSMDEVVYIEYFDFGNDLF